MASGLIAAVDAFDVVMRIEFHFEYGSTILYTCCTDDQINRLQKLQNKAM